MPEPVPAPETEQLVIVGEIMMVDPESVLAIVSGGTSQEFSNVKWSRTLAEIANWDAIRSDSGDVKKLGRLEFFENKNVSTRLDFRNMIRTRYGLVPLDSEVFASSEPEFACGVELEDCCS